MVDYAPEEQLVTPAPADYKGSAWRARFLRAPKVAMDLAKREDFVPLQRIATCKLGLKTGADSFFLLERILGKPEKTLLTSRGVITVRGFNGWQGELATSDVLPAVLNPHQMTAGEFRFFSVPAVSKYVYLYPKPGRLKKSLADYVRLGELAGLHQKALVVSNSEEDRWYKQARGLVNSEWILPYNSAYDYGAWRNPHRAILNGRFVGVEPLQGVDTRLLGACLNSTFAAVGRLIEGVATGVEGAFDVGPPAARRIMLPDVRRFSDTGREEVIEILDQMLSEDRVLPSPASNGSVVSLRRRLDSALLCALGLTRGQASVVLDRMYAGYGRWRSNIQAVEEQMRGFRKQMKSTGQSRDIRPAEAAGKRVWEEIEHLVRVLPRDVLPSSETLEVVNIPANAQLSASRPLFDEGVVMVRGKRVDLGSFERVRYVNMLRTIGVVGNVSIPISPVRAGAIVDMFEKEAHRLEELAKQSASKYVAAGESLSEIVQIAIQHWYAVCRKADLLKPVSDGKAKSKMIN